MYCNLCCNVEYRNKHKFDYFSDDFNNADDIARFLSILGAEKLKQIPDETVGGDDAQFEKHEESLVSLHKVSDASGSIKVEKINQKPLKQQMLDTNDCFILDTEQSDIYVWQGKKATPKEKSEAIKKAEDIKKAKKYPAWTKIVKVIEHGEPSVFRQIFQTWQGVGETRPRLIRDTSNFAVCEPGKAKLYHLKAFDSKLFVKFISQFDQHNLKSDDVMIVDDGCKIFVWFGKDSSDYERMQGLRPSKVNNFFFKCLSTNI